MNEQAARALYEAERKGVRQITGAFADDSGGRCALGVIYEAAGVNLDRRRFCPLPSLGLSCEFGEYAVPCPMCGIPFGHSQGVVSHLNDEHRLTFAEIARKLGPDSL